ncbi:hypothetical protein ACFY3M_51470 [Streptomyces mirabilis]
MVVVAVHRSTHAPHIGGTKVLFAVQRAVAALGHCEAPALRHAFDPRRR